MHQGVSLECPRALGPAFRTRRHPGRASDQIFLIHLLKADEAGPRFARPFPATPPVRGRQTGMKDYPLLEKGEFMKNTKRCSSYRLKTEKLERGLVVATMIG